MIIKNVFYCGADRNFDTESTYFYVGHCSSGRSWFGEEIKLVRATKQHLVFRAVKSGVEIKTKRDNLHQVVGKAAKCGLSVSAFEPPIVWNENERFEVQTILW